MRLSFLHKPERQPARKLPKSIRKHMINRFHLLPKYVDALRYIEIDCEIRGTKTRYFRIFNPHMAGEFHPGVYATDLEQHPNMVIYEGHMNSHGDIHITDLSQMSNYGNRDTRKKVKTYWF